MRSSIGKKAAFSVNNSVRSERQFVDYGGLVSSRHDSPVDVEDGAGNPICLRAQQEGDGVGDIRHGAHPS